MKTKKMILVAVMAMCATALMAFTVMPETDKQKDSEKTKSQSEVAPSEVEKESDVLCACSELRCGICNGKVQWTVNAYVKVRKKCNTCKGKGYVENSYTGRSECPNPFCEDGIHIEWGAGCRCYHCNQGFKQPNDC